MAITFIDLFAGIGGFHEAFKGLATCIFASEIDKFAIKTYEANHKMIPAGDITKIEAKDIPSHDILCAGFPCQSFSIAGKRKGFEDIRGTMFFEVVRIIEYHKPKVILLENVKGLLSHNKGNTFMTIINTLIELGYDVTWHIMNAKDYGVPQNRERVFIIGFKAMHDHEFVRSFVWPEKIPLTKTLSDILEKDNLGKFVISNKLWEGHQRRKNNHKNKGNGFGYSLVNYETKYTNTLSARYYKDGSEILVMCDTRNGKNVIHSWDVIETTNREKDICLTILNNRRKKKYGTKDGNPIRFEDLQKLIENIEKHEINKLCEKNILSETDEGIVFINSKNSAGINGIYRLIGEKSIFPTLTASQGNDYIQQNNNPRKLTPRECARLQGFPDDFEIPVSNAQAYKQFGNAICVSVVREIAKEIINILNHI